MNSTMPDGSAAGCGISGVGGVAVAERVKVLKTCITCRKPFEAKPKSTASYCPKCRRRHSTPIVAPRGLITEH